ncbi:hypothetical protein WISP_50967 [Willisornis vidua]|uniref:Uncharacterized protein n=1 Tax=Willisornis vidua TaxID=1566151 RepID=A0ABQ9DI77_9PASS|nr:hypothetical protein WISP_50967 [Willisornis vidua]
MTKDEGSGCNEGVPLRSGEPVVSWGASGYGGPVGREREDEPGEKQIIQLHEILELHRWSLLPPWVQALPHAMLTYCVAEALASVRCLGRGSDIFFLLHDGVQSVMPPHKHFTCQPPQSTPPTDEATMKPSPDTPQPGHDMSTCPPDCQQG